MGSVILSPPNAILFLMDPDNREVEIPAYIDDHLVASSESCISVGTQVSVDGPTAVTLALGGVAPKHLLLIATVGVFLPMRNLAVVTSEFEVILRQEVAKEVARVSIWVDDGRNPAKVFIGVV